MFGLVKLKQFGGGVSRKTRLFLILVLTIVAMSVSFVSTYAQKLKFSGYGATGYIFTDRNILNGYNQETYYEGKLQAEIKISKEIEGQIDLRGNSADNNVQFREFSVKFEITERLNIKAGNLKKPFGHEQLFNREELVTIDRGYTQNAAEELGYGGRSVSLMVYNKYSKKDPGFPFSYYLSLFKNNSLTQGLAARFGYHIDELAFSANYLLQQKGGENKISAGGLSADIEYETKEFTCGVELFFIQDPVEGIRRRLMNLDDKIYATGGTARGSYYFKFDEKFLKGIEPLLLFSYFRPDSKESGDHIIQTVAGLNIYVHEDVRVRLNGDLRLTKNRFNDDYSTNESRGVFEIQLRF